MASRVQEIDTLREEIGFQRAILASLEDAPGLGTKEARTNASREIELLSKRLQQLRSQSSSMPTLSQISSELHSEPKPNTAAGPPTTPISLPSRKRDFGHRGSPPSSGLYSKSRKCTPISSASRNSSRNRYDDISTEDVDVIDLTGDDVSDVPGYIAAQKHQERLAAQRRKDFELAERLHASQLGGQSSPSVKTPTDSQANPLQKLMSNARMIGASSHGHPSDKISSPTDRSPDKMATTNPMYSPKSLREEMAPFPITAQEKEILAQKLAADAERTRALINLRQHQNRIMPQQQCGQQWQPMQQPEITPKKDFDKFHNLPGAFPDSNPQWSAQKPSFQASQPALIAPSIWTRWPYVPSMGAASSTMSEIINRTSAYATGNLPGNDYPPMTSRMSTFLDMTSDNEKMTDKELEELLQNIRPDQEIPLTERCECVKGLKVKIYHHQQLALKWMQNMEKGSNCGGILADDMGLGKTISTLALMVTRPATARPKTNLIIGPVALIRQWEEEIRTKTSTSSRLSVFVYHGRKSTVDELLTYDVVMTTYGTIAQELKKLQTYIDENAERNVDFNDRYTAMKFPLLHPTKARFYRVILDEAQCIKNKDTQTAKACHRLRAKYRWCLTGTPMMNGVQELYSLIAFLRIKPYCDWQRFRTQFGQLYGKRGDEKSDAMAALRVLLKATMLRRKKNSLLDGKPIVNLPEKTEQVVYAKLSDDERDYYNQLEAKAQVQFNKYLREGSIGKNYSNILVLLLRLRQTCCHPHLNLDVTDNSTVSPEEVEDLVKELGPAIVARIKAADGFECPICYDAVPSPAFFIPCGHDSCSQCLSRITDNAATSNLQEGRESDKVKCPVCREPFDPRKCFTLESFRRIHMPKALEKEPHEDESGDEMTDEDALSEIGDSESDLEDNKDDVDEKGNLAGFVVDDNCSGESDEEKDVKPGVSKVKLQAEESEDEKQRKAEIKKGKQVQGSAKTKKRKTKKTAQKKKQEDTNGEKVIKVDIKPSMLRDLRNEARKSREAYRKYMNYLRKTWLPAAKVTECMRLLQEAHAQGRKSIVFSQWTLLLDLIEVALEHEEMGVKPERYDGGMSGEERNAVAKAFQDPSRRDVSVMLVSLRAGNAGLNLTQATRVIIMDPFWNPYIEMQAVDRAYRIGQTRPVEVFRILTQETVEDRIVALKEKKQAMVEAALDERESARIGRLGVSELKFLFRAC